MHIERIIIDLIIVGAGGHGRCCLDIARDKYDDIVFLDDGLIGKTINGCKVVAGMNDMGQLFGKYSNIFIAIGNNKLREELITQAQEIGVNIVNLIKQEISLFKLCKNRSWMCYFF